MKRDNRDNGSYAPPIKQQKVDLSNISVRFLIPARAAGLIIGKGGENIKKIRSQYSVKLNIPDSRGTERIFTVEGELTAIGNVMRELVPKLKDIMNAKLSDPKRLMGIQRPPRIRRGPDGEEIEQEEGDEGMIDIRILVHQSVAGSIIGKGGDRIREFRSKHKMRVIKVYQTLAPASTDRVVQLVAEPENAINCLQSVVEVVENTPIRGPTEYYDSGNSSEEIALSYGGWLSPEGQRAYSQGIPMNPVPEMGGPRGMPPMGRGDMYARDDPYNRGPHVPHNMPPPNMYDSGRPMTGPPPVCPPVRRGSYEPNPTYRAPPNYDGMPPMSMRGPANIPMNTMGYEEQVGSYQPPSGGYGGGMVLQSTGGYGGPVPRGQSEMGVVGQMPPPYKSGPQAMYGAHQGGYGGGATDDGKTGQWGW